MNKQLSNLLPRSPLGYFVMILTGYAINYVGLSPVLATVLIIVGVIGFIKTFRRGNKNNE